MEQAPVVVRERQVEQHHVAGLGEPVFHLVGLLHHRVVVAVADHAGLRRAGRPRGVDEREELVLVDRVGALVERGRVLCGVRPSALSQRVELRERDHVRDARRRRPWRAGRRPRRAPRPPRECSRTYCVSRAELDGVDRRTDRADECQREVEQRPLEARAREQCRRLRPSGCRARAGRLRARRRPGPHPPR